MESKFRNGKNRIEDHRLESEIDFEEKLVLAERIRTYRALRGLQKK